MLEGDGWFIKHYDPDGWMLVLKILGTGKIESLKRRARKKLESTGTDFTLGPVDSVSTHSFPPSWVGLHKSVVFKLKESHGNR